jgi:hypothetical protein
LRVPLRTPWFQTTVGSTEIGLVPNAAAEVVTAACGDDDWADVDARRRVVAGSVGETSVGETSVGETSAAAGGIPGVAAA